MHTAEILTELCERKKLDTKASQPDSSSTSCVGTRLTVGLEWLGRAKLAPCLCHRRGEETERVRFRQETRESGERTCRTWSTLSMNDRRKASRNVPN